MPAQRVPVEDLRFGMYVAELDRPWTDTPFTFQGFMLRNDRQLDTLRKFCRHVYVDAEKSDSDAAALLKAAGEGRREYVDRLTVENELASANRTYAECERALQAGLDALRSGGEIDAEQLKAATTAVSDSVVRNADAMLLLTKLRQKGDYELKRALETSVLMITFGRFLQLEREQLDSLGLAGLLQDVGKVRVADEVLRKPGPLTAEELKMAQMHVVHSGELLGDVPGLAPAVVNTILLHHERQDGSGYPLGLAAPAIDMSGAMAAIVDTFSALTSLRPYAPQISPSDALGQLYKSRGTLFHPALVEQFIRCIGIYPVGSVVELNTAEVAIVIAQNHVRRLQPRVMVVFDASGNPVRPQKILDLMKEPKAGADQPYRIRRTLEASRLPLDPRDFFF